MHNYCCLKKKLSCLSSKAYIIHKYLLCPYIYCKAQSQLQLSWTELALLSFYYSIATVTSSIATVTSSITTVTSSIATVTSSIATVTTSIATVTSGIVVKVYCQAPAPAELS